MSEILHFLTFDKEKEEEETKTSGRYNEIFWNLKARNFK